MKVIAKDFGVYSEMAQTNPITWAILKKVGDTFEFQTSVLKCKDFFNDWVYTRKTGKSVSIYGFQTKNITNSPTDAGFVLVMNLTNEFRNNLKVLNSWLEKQGTPGIFIIENIETTIEGKSLIIEIPPYFLENTYRISLLSLLIRLMNVTFDFESWHSILNYPFNYQDIHLFNRVKARDLWFKPHPKIDQYIWYAGEKYNSKYTESLPPLSYIHNNGIVNWGNFL